MSRRSIPSLFYKVFCSLSVGFLVFFLWTRYIPWRREIVIVEARATPSLRCHDTMGVMLDGRWEKGPYTEMQMHDLKYFLHASRSQHFLPYNLQRSDSLCGNITFDETEGRMNALHWFRALCDPDGDTPCCYDNRCVSKKQEECKCDNCYDMRQPIPTEFSTWVPHDTTCKIANFTTEEDVCEVLKNMTIYIIGDSFMRHVYISLLDLLRSKKFYGPLRQFSPPGMIHACNQNKQFLYLHMCMNYIDKDTWECQRQVKLRFMENPRADHSNSTLKAVQELLGKPNSLVFLGIGIHDDFNVTMIVRELVNPLMSLLSHSPWPRVLWSAMHAPGLLKTPRLPSQTKAGILKYNAILRTILDVWRVPIFDSFNLTDGTLSFDGAHYGKGVNDAKAQVFLNYVMELRQALGQM